MATSTVVTGSPKRGPIASDADISMSRENQKKINTFAIRNGWLEELNTQLKQKQNDIKNLQDAEADILMLDDTELVPIVVGDCFVYYSQDKALETVNTKTEKTTEDIKKIEGRIAEIKGEMAALKSELYSQFGENINLENEDE